MGEWKKYFSPKMNQWFIEIAGEGKMEIHTDNNNNKKKP